MIGCVLSVVMDVPGWGGCVCFVGKCGSTAVEVLQWGQTGTMQKLLVLIKNI